MADEATKDDDDAFAEPQEEVEEEKTEGEEPENQEEKDEDKTRRSEIAQKKHWREKAKSASSKVKELEAELEKLKGAVKKPDDEKEAAAQEYIRKQARDVYKELLLERSKEEAKELAEFEDKVQEVLDENPDVAEEELLDAIEEYEVEPRTALKILQKQSGTKEKKPKMPKSRQASTEVENKDKPDDSKKSMWQIAKEEKDKLLNKIK